MSSTVASINPEIDWGQALLEHGRWLRSVVLARVREAHAAEEVMQEVALAACRQRPVLEDSGKVGHWLYRTAVRQALLHRRRQGRARRLVSSAAEVSPRETEMTADPLGWLLRLERQDLVRQALVNLPARDAEILLLKYSENWSYRELAEKLAISETAVEARLHRARARLREALVRGRVWE